MPTSSGILHSFILKSFTEKETMESLSHKELLVHNKKRGDFLRPLNFYLAILDDVDPVMFLYMDPAKKEQLEYDLRITHLLLSAQQEYEITYQKTENKKKYEEKIKQCTQLIACINNTLPHHPEPHSPVNYLGIFLGQEFGKQMVALMDRKSKTIKDLVGALNEKRLYWVWGSVLLKTVLEMVPEDFFNTAQAGQAAKVPDPYMGCLSWSIYYFRGALHLFLLLKHTIKGPWMSPEEASIPWDERFRTQWAQRKFNLLNDFIWATANLLCFFWLNAKNALGPWGDLLTVVLLVFDVSVALWDWEEQKTEYEQSVLQFDQDINQLQEKIASEQNLAKKARYQMQLEALKRQQKQCDKDWNHKKLILIKDTAYAVGLTLAFVILTVPFMPIPAAAVVSLGILGAVLCFAFTVINSAIKGGLELYKTHQTLKEIKENYHEKILEFIKLAEDDEAKKLLFLEIRQLEAKTEKQKQMLVYQSVNLVRTIMLEALIPAIVFSCLVFFPLGIGLGVLGAALGLAIASQLLINQLKPKNSEQLDTFPEEEYKKFCELIKQNDSQSESVDTATPHTFFDNKAKAKKAAAASTAAPSPEFDTMVPVPYTKT